jgi:hypothetical protein
VQTFNVEIYKNTRLRSFPWIWRVNTVDGVYVAHGSTSTRFGAKIEAKGAIKRHVRGEYTKYQEYEVRA